MANKYSVPLEYLVNLNSHSNFKCDGKWNLSQLPTWNNREKKLKRIFFASGQDKNLARGEVAANFNQAKVGSLVVVGTARFRLDKLRTLMFDHYPWPGAAFTTLRFLCNSRILPIWQIVCLCKIFSQVYVVQHSTLFGPFVSKEENKVLWIRSLHCNNILLTIVSDDHKWCLYYKCSISSSHSLWCQLCL